MNKYTILALTLSLFALTGCGKDCDPTTVTVPGPTVYVPAPPAAAPTPEEAELANIAAVLADENAYRTGLGQTILSTGLSCTLYTVTGGSRIQSGANTLTGISQKATFLGSGVFNQPNSNISDGMNVLPPALRSVYQNMYLLRCTGQIIVTKTDYYQFELASDDGSLLYLDGSLLVDNDDNHGIVTKTGSKLLRRGVHAFRLDYAQTGAGAQALQLTVGGSYVPANYFVH